jgi:hypothetical protein
MKLGNSFIDKVRITRGMSPIRRFYALNNKKVCLVDTLNVICPNDIEYWDFALEDIKIFEKILENYSKSNVSGDKDVVICEMICNDKFQNGKELVRGIGFVFFVYSENVKKPVMYSFIIPYGDLIVASGDFYDRLLEVLFLFVKDTHESSKIESLKIEEVINRYINSLRIALKFCNYDVRFYSKSDDELIFPESDKIEMFNYKNSKIKLNDNDEFDLECLRPVVFLPFYTDLTVIER